MFYIARAQSFAECAQWVNHVVFEGLEVQQLFNRAGCDMSTAYTTLYAYFEDLPAPTPSIDDSDPLSSGAIAGIIISCVLVVAIAVVVGVYCVVIKSRPIYSSDFSEKQNEETNLSNNL